MIDIGLQFAKDILKSQKEGNKLPKTPYLMVHGGAGTGKTFVINTLAQWIQHKLQK